MGGWWTTSSVYRESNFLEARVFRPDGGCWAGWIVPATIEPGGPNLDPYPRFCWFVEPIQIQLGARHQAARRVAPCLRGIRYR